jgi:hypothetical protein
VAHAYNPSNSVGRDQEDHSSKPAWANSSQDPSLKIPITEKRWVEWLKAKSLSSSPTPEKKNLNYAVQLMC